jgi:tRNA(fMet)-specific endonuclease VapC
VALILDTNALSALAEGDESLRGALGGQYELAVPVIVLGEYLFGIQQSRLRVRYEQWLDANLQLFDMLLVGRETARHYAEIRRELKVAGRPIPSNDIWIAALTREHHSPLVSRDLHFEAVGGLRVVTW